MGGRLNSPIPYFGGKNKMVDLLLPMIPKHKIYLEPFFGGGSVFFAKNKVNCEIINDLNNRCITFYKVIQNNFYELKKKIDDSLYAETLHEQAKDIYLGNVEATDVDIAWSFYFLSRSCFGSKIESTFNLEKNKADKQPAKTFANSKRYFDDTYCKRLEGVQILNRNATELIASMKENCDDVFIFIDPPYINTTLGHYKGYKYEEYETLLQVLSETKCKFLLTTFETDILEEYTKKNGWFTEKFEMCTAMKQCRYNQKTIKVEVVTTNYQIHDNQLKLF